MADNDDSLAEEIPSRYSQLSRLGAGGASMVVAALLGITAFALYALKPDATFSAQSSLSLSSPLAVEVAEKGTKQAMGIANLAIGESGSDDKIRRVDVAVGGIKQALPSFAIAETRPDVVLRNKLRRYAKNAYKKAVSFEEAKRYCGYSDGDPPQLKIVKLENFLEAGKVCDLVYNELRHQYLAIGDEKTSMEYSNIALYRAPCSDYIMNCIDNWTYHKKEYAACIKRLGEVGSKYPQLRFLHASCIIRCGRAAQQLNKQSAAKVFFRQAQEVAPDLRYRQLVQYLQLADGK